MCAVCLTLLLLAPARADGPVTPEYFSMDDGGVTSYDPNLLALARATGAPQLRMSVYWRLLEPTNTTPENYQWEFFDAYFARAFNGGMTPVPFVTENPDWAANTGCGPIDTTNPAMLAEFAEFMGALAARYPQIKIWILYNEVDSRYMGHSGGCFGDSVTGDINNNGRPDYGDYAEMAGAARDAVHQNNPEALVSLAVALDDFDKETCPPDYPGGCPPASHLNYYFLPNLFGYMTAHPRANGQPYADLLTFTYYDIYGPYWERQPSGAGWRGIQAKAAAIRQRMNDAGVSFPMFVTETGDDSTWLGAEGQSRCMSITMLRGIAADLRTIVWWTFVDNPARDWYYGLVDTNAAPKPSYQAYKTLFNEFNGWTMMAKWRKGKKIEGYKFGLNGKRKWALWSADTVANEKSPCAHPRNTQYVTLKAKRLRVTNLYGVSKVVRDNHRGDADARVGYVSIPLDGAPQYVTVIP